MYVIRDTEKCPLSVLAGVRIKRVTFRENIWAFCPQPKKYNTGAYHNQNYSGTAVSHIIPEMYGIALVVNLKWPFLNLGAVPPHPHPDPSGCARVSVTQSPCLIMAEGQQNLNKFLTRISSSKQDFNGF